MTQSRPNVLFLSFDALRADRTSAYGYHRPTTPALDRLAEDAIVCRNAISPCAFTQPSFASFFTSSLPLSYGGYDNGAAGRPRHLFKAFHETGYETSLIATFPWVSRFYGYREGVDRECLLFVLNALVGVAANTMKNSIIGYQDGTFSHAEAFELIEPVVEKFFCDVTEYCEARLAQEATDRIDFARERLILNGYDFARVLRSVRDHRELFRANPQNYIDSHFTKVPAAHEWIAEDWRYARRPGALISTALRRALGAIVGYVSPGVAGIREYRAKRYIDGHALTDRIIRMIDSRDQERPFFMWTHYVDTHVPYCPGPAPDWYRHTPSYLRALGYPESLNPAIAVGGKPTDDEGWAGWSAMYDCAVRYIDDQIARITEALDARGLRNDTWIVVCGDHGEELGEHGDISHHFRLYDHNLRVPLIFHRPGAGRRDINDLTSLLDIGPTLMELTGGSSDSGWVGASVVGSVPQTRDNILIETFHGGNCLFNNRPLYMAARNKRWNYLWKEYRDPTDRYSPEDHELFDMNVDPLEQNNVYRADHPEVIQFNRLIEARLREIPEVGPARAAAAFQAAVSGRGAAE